MAWYYYLKLLWIHFKKTCYLKVVLNVGCYFGLLLLLIVTEKTTRPTFLGRQNQKWLFGNTQGVTRDELKFQSMLLKTPYGVFSLGRTALSREVENALKQETRGVIIQTIQNNERLSIYKDFICAGFAPEYISFCGKTLFHHSCFFDDMSSRDPKTVIMNFAKELTLISSEIGMYMYFKLDIENFDCQNIKDCVRNLIVKPLLTYTISSDIYPIVINFIEDCRRSSDEQSNISITDVIRYLVKMLPRQFKLIVITRESAEVELLEKVFGWLFILDVYKAFTTGSSALAKFEYHDTSFSTTDIVTIGNCVDAKGGLLDLAIIGWIYTRKGLNKEPRYLLTVIPLILFYRFEKDISWNKIKQLFKSRKGSIGPSQSETALAALDMRIGHCVDTENQFLMMLIIGFMLHIEVDPLYKEPLFLFFVITSAKTFVVIVIVTSMTIMVLLCYLLFGVKNQKAENEHKESYIDLELHHKSIDGFKRDELSGFELFYVVKLDGCENQTQFRTNLLDASRRNQSILCRWLLLNVQNYSLQSDVLERALDIAFTNVNKHVAKAVSWTVTKLFFNSNKCKLTNVLNLYPAIKCACKYRGENKHWMCSKEKTIVAIFENGRSMSQIPKQYRGFTIHKIFHNKNYSEGIEISRRLNKIFSNSVVLRNNIPNNRVSNLFKAHSNLTLLCASPVKSSLFGSSAHELRKEMCFQVYCLAKGMLPMGEQHFPLEVSEYCTDIIEGRSYFISNLHVGEKIGTQLSMGTLGGFVHYFNYDCFLTCAHVMFDTHTLLTSSSNFASLTGSTAYTHNAQPATEIGQVIWRAFEHGDKFKTSIDAALVHLQNNAVIDPNDYILDSAGNPCHFSRIGLNSKFINENFVDPEDVCGRPQVSTLVAAGARTQLEESGHFPKRSEIEVLFDDLGQTSAQVNGSNFFPLIISCPAHMQLSVGQLGHSHRRTFVMYNQIVIPNLNLQQGDSGTCLYIINHPENKNGCIGMAIAFCSGVTVVTPMKDILQRINS